MPALDLIVRGGRLVQGAGVRRADLGVAGGRIVALQEELADDAADTIDAAGLLVLPGVIDAHVHFNEPGRTHWEGLASGSAALAAGGGTLFIDMPLNSSPPVLDRASLLAKRAAAEASSHTDFALWGGLTPANLDRLPELAEAGVVGFKAFMSDSGLDEFAAVDDLSLLEGMRTAAALGLPVAVHAESESLTRALTRRAREAGRTRPSDYRDYLASRPALAELEAIGRAILFARETGCSLHVVHVSTAAGVALVRDARAAGVRVSCETCPHYLHFSAEDMERLGARLKCAPPLRASAERDALWRALDEIDLIASDHSPCPPELKAQGDIFEAWGGIAGVQSTLAVLLSRRDDAAGLTLERIARLVATAPAERFALAGKGRLEPGFDADLVLVDARAEWTLGEDDLLDRHRASPYLGTRFRGRVVRTVGRGRTLYLDGRMAPRGEARLVRPAARDDDPPGRAPP